MEQEWAELAVSDEPNQHAGMVSFVWAMVAYVVLLVVVIPRTEDHTGAYMAGRMMVPAGAAWGLTWLIAHNSNRHWRWWVYPLVVPAIVAAIALALSAKALIDRDGSGRFADRGAAPEDSGPVIHELTAPATQGKWTKVDNPAVRDEVDRIEQGIAQFGPDIDSAVAGYYTHESTRAGLAGAYVDDYDTYNPGAAGGVLGCGNAAAKGSEWFACMWIGNERTVFMRWDDRSLEPDVAAQLTTEFRDLAATG